MVSLEGTDSTSPAALAYLRAQVSSDDAELREIMKPLRAPVKRREKVVAEEEHEQHEISQSVLHYQQMAQLMPVWDQGYSKANANTGSKGKSAGTGVWGYHHVHPRSSGARAVRV
jgi:DNA polymerase gamma 1